MRKLVSVGRYNHTQGIWICSSFNMLKLTSSSSSECSAEGQVFHWKLRNQGCSCAQRQVFPANSRNKVAVLLGMNRCGSFPLLSASHSLFSIWTDLKRSEKIPGALAWRWGEWIWVSGPSGVYRNSPQGLNISSFRGFDQIRDPQIPIALPPPNPWKR